MRLPAPQIQLPPLLCVRVLQRRSETGKALLFLLQAKLHPPQDDKCLTCKRQLQSLAKM